MSNDIRKYAKQLIDALKESEAIDDGYGDVKDPDGVVTDNVLYDAMRDLERALEAKPSPPSTTKQLEKRIVMHIMMARVNDPTFDEEQVMEWLRAVVAENIDFDIPPAMDLSLFEQYNSEEKSKLTLAEWADLHRVEVYTFRDWEFHRYCFRAHLTKEAEKQAFDLSDYDVSTSGPTIWFVKKG